ncbi:MAG: response regulator [Boseongicola sp.]|nr:response regulator [Boseongicola sp.]
MTRTDDARRENEALRARMAALHAAVLRINASLDLDKVLREVMDSARGLAGARYGVIVTVDDDGAPQDCIFSGLTSAQESELLAWPGGLRIFDLLRTLPSPVRLADFPGWVSEMDADGAGTFSGAYSGSLQGTPLRHRGADVGHFFLAEKADGEAFTDEDEEVLELFAAQAASAIANARTTRAERRARADLEALVETAPVGVVVFDVQSGRPVSINREVRRIVERLRMPGRPPEHLLEVLTFHREGDDAVALSEFPIALQLGRGETVRAEEFALSVPDGRSVRTLVNSTPILAADGTVERVVVTLQDLEPLDEIERMRTEFIGLVSHELRTPLAAIKGSAATVLNASPELDPAEAGQFFRVIDEQADHMQGLISDLLDAGRIDAGTLSVAPVASDVAELVERARSTFLGAGGRHDVVFDLPSGLPAVMADRRRIVQVLNNLLSNAARHAPASAPVRVAAASEDGMVAVSVSDNGRGATPERLARLFRKHAAFGGEGGRAEAHGSGLGLAICKGLVEAHGGRIRAESDGPGRGMTVTFTLPVTGETGTDAVPPVPAAKPDERARVLVVDDDPRSLRFVRDALSGAGFATLVTGEPQEVARIIRAERPRLVLLDLILPGSDGIELMQHVPELTDLPVIFISAFGRDETVARALEAGATDYIVKPFSQTELVARVRAALRRHERPGPFVSGELKIDYDLRRVTVRGSEVHLTATEYGVLSVLSLNAGRVVPYETLLNQVWNGKSHADANIVRIFIRHLRRKLGDDASRPVWIFNHRGVGYRMPEPEGK